VSEPTFCARCGREYPAEGTWEQRMEWFDHDEGIVCKHCMTAEEWKEAFAVAAARIREPPGQRLIVALAQKLAEAPDETTAAHLVYALVDVMRGRGRQPVQETLAAILVTFRGEVAIARILEEAIQRLAQYE